jgi:RNA polymerase sigma-70 factor (ECF subfamily)
MQLYDTIDNEGLMSRFREEGDLKAFEHLVARHAAKALVVATNRLHDRSLAEDAVQEAFIRLLRKRDQYTAGRPFAGWFYAILRNVCTDIVRKRSREAGAVQTLSLERTSPGASPELPDAHALLATLPSAERVVLELRVLHDLAFREIAAALEISEEAAKKRAQRGLRRLRLTAATTAEQQRRAV